MVVYSHYLFELNYKVRLTKVEREAFHILYFVKVPTCLKNPNTSNGFILILHRKSIKILAAEYWL